MSSFRPMLIASKKRVKVYLRDDRYFTKIFFLLNVNTWKTKILGFAWDCILEKNPKIMEISLLSLIINIFTYTVTATGH